MSRWYARPCVLVALLLASACAPGDPAEALLEDYRRRVVRTLDGAPGPAPEIRVAPWPRPRDRLVELPRQRVDLVDFLRLQDCGLGTLVGERSSSLGRVMQPPERLRYEHAFLAAAERCLADPAVAEDDEVRPLLEELLVAKRAALPLVARNATLASRAVAVQHAVGVPSLEPGSARGLGDAELDALHGLADRVTGRVSAGDPRWHEPWATLESSRFGGRLHRSVVVLATHLEAVSARLEAHAPLCPAGRPGERARILENLFLRYYAQGVQPYLGAVDRAATSWHDALAALAAASEAPAGVLQPDPVRRAVERLRGARDRHTRLWQDVLGGCGLGPGRT